MYTLHSNNNNWLTTFLLHISQNKHLFEYPTQGIACQPTKFIIESALIHRNTNNFPDIEFLVSKIWERLYFQESARFCIIYGDEQTVALMWSCILSNPEEYMWMLPFPGEMHFCMNLLHGCYRMFSPLLLWFANHIGRTNISINFRSAFYTKQEDFFFLSLEAIWKWLCNLRGFPNNLTASQMLTLTAESKPTYYLLFFLFNYGLFYWDLRQNIRSNNEKAVTSAWIQSWHIFHATNKYHYSKLSLIATYCRLFSHDYIKQILSERLCSMKGIPGHSFRTDIKKFSEKFCLAEKINIVLIII